MQIPPQKLRDILFPIGVHIGPDLCNYNRGSVTQYISREYLNSERHETDEAYRMFEGNLLHNESGVRVTYTSAEDYYGEHVDYKVISLFILTADNRKLAVEDVDFEKQTILTTEGPVLFSETNKNVED